MKRLLLSVGLAAALLTGAVAVPSFAFDPASSSAVNVDADGLGLRGYDPVAYFTAGAPTEGSVELTASHAGVTYRFASEANRDEFLQDPAKYAPQYGGFCQMGAAVNKKFDGDPSVWRVEDGKLFVYAYPAAKDAFVKDIPSNTEKADTNWPLIKDKAPKDL